MSFRTKDNVNVEALVDDDGANPRIMALVCTALTGTATVNAAIGFKEYY